jgi:hypothetical protein
MQQVVPATKESPVIPAPSPTFDIAFISVEPIARRRVHMRFNSRHVIDWVTVAEDDCAAEFVTVTLTVKLPALL